MKTNLLLFLSFFGLTQLAGQNYYKIVFSGEPETVLIENLTKGTTVSIQGTDTLHLKLEGTSVSETEKSKRKLNIYPNPMDHSCNFDFENAQHGPVIIQIYQTQGSLVHEYNHILPQGIHHFQLIGVPAGIYAILVKTNTYQITGSFVSTIGSTPGISLIHKNVTPFYIVDKNTENEPNDSRYGDTPLNFRSVVEMDFTAGDQLKFVGYATGSENDIVYSSPTGDQTINFTFCRKPTQPSDITGSNQPCQGGTEQYSVTSVPDVTYLWIVPTGWTITSSQNSSITVTVGTTGGNITVIPSNDCGIGTARSLAVSTQLAPQQPSIINGNTSPCQGTTENYSVADVPGVTFNWTLPAGWTITSGQGTNNITVLAGAGSGNMIVTPSVGDCNGIDRTLTIYTQVYPAQPSEIIGSAQPCQGATENYSVNGIPGMTYLWIVPTGWTITSNQNSNITVTVGTSNGNITVIPSNNCGVGTARSLGVNTQLAPEQTSVISGNTSPCQGTTGNYSVIHVPGLTYTWVTPIDWSITSGQGTNSITVFTGGASGNMTVTPSVGNCFGAERALAINTQVFPSQPSEIIGNPQPCQGATENYSVTNIPGLTYLWIVPTGWTITDSQNSHITIKVGSGSGLISVFPTNECGIGIARNLSVSTLVTFTYNGSSVTYGTVSSSNNKCWLDRNIGAMQVATSSSDTASFGDLFQWGRMDDGHQVRTSLTTSTLSSNDIPGHGSFILASAEPYDWRYPQNDNLWQGVFGINNPCPNGYRLPTYSEWETERLSWHTNNSNGAFDSPLKLPVSGFRSYIGGGVNTLGADGFYWSSNLNNSNAWGIFFSSDSSLLYEYDRSFGMSVRCLKDCVVPSSPTSGINIPLQTQIVWNWNKEEGATGYKYNTVNNYETATDIGISTSYLQPDLNCDSLYTLYVWAYSACGISSALTISQMTSPCTSDCGNNVTFMYNGNSVSYRTVLSANNRCWLDRNLGAMQVATSSSDTASFGDLFQWGRMDDGHQVRTSLTTSTLSSNDIPGHGNFILPSAEPYDWRYPQNDNLWQGVFGINNPCPIGYRLPTKAEWDAERESWITNNAAGAYISPLKLSLAGSRNIYNDNGTVQGEGFEGIYWSMSVDEFYWNWSLQFYGEGALLSPEIRRAEGASVRCIKDCVITPIADKHIPSQTQIIWKWNPTDEATGYKYNFYNDYSSAIDNGNSTSFIQSGLECSTQYSIYVWAYNSCGSSLVLRLTERTTCCESSITFNYNGNEVTYCVVSGANNRYWLDRNLGATQVATSIDDTSSYGDLYQWGRLEDGHQLRTSPTTNKLSNSVVPGHGDFILNPDFRYDWLRTLNNNLWQGVNGINNPCPDGFRLPTKAEWETEYLSWEKSNFIGAFESPLKLPLSGSRDKVDGTIWGEGLYSNYWSSTVNGTNAWFLGISGNLILFYDYRANGNSVRCIKN